MEVHVENIWTYLKEDSLDRSLLRAIEKEMSYTVQQYSRFRRTMIDFEYSLFDRKKVRYPTGLFSNLKSVLDENDIDYEIIDKRKKTIQSSSLTLHSKKLRDYQEETIEKAIKAERGIIKVATGGGKTVIAAGIIARLNIKTLFIVNSLDLLEQAYDEFTEMLQIDIGKVGGGYCDIKQINVCTIQTLHSAFGLKYKAVDEECQIKEKISKNILERKSEIQKMVRYSELVIVDEVQHSSGQSYINMMKKAERAFWKLGLCLHPDTKILLADGRQKKISYLPSKVEVLTFNTEKKILEKKRAKVLKIPKEEKQLIQFTILDSNNKKIKIISTEEHKFYTQEKWIEAKDLKINDKVNLIEPIKRYCQREGCSKELTKWYQKVYCSNKCKNEVCQKIMAERKKELGNVLGFLKFKDHEGIIIEKKYVKSAVKYLYDLTILNVRKENQNFFANNVLVHNSATPFRNESIDILLNAYSGKLITNIDASYLIDRGFLVSPHIYFLDPNLLARYKFVNGRFSDIYKEWIVENKLRNNLIIDCTRRLVELEKTILITVSRIVHGEIIMENLEKKLQGVKSAFIRGEVNKNDRKVLLNQIRNRELQILVGTSVADEGLDLPALDSAIIAGGGKSLIKTLQRVGRTLRPYPSAEENIKEKALIVDFYDNLRYLTGQSKTRMKIYKQEKRFKIYEHF